MLTTINVFPGITLKQLQEFSELWERTDEVTVTVPDSLSGSELRNLFNMALSILPNEFAFSVLEDLAERENTPMDLLELLFERGNTGNKETICLRSDLSEELKEACRKYKPQH